MENKYNKVQTMKGALICIANELAELNKNIKLKINKK
jgi:hypothetical protein